MPDRVLLRQPGTANDGLARTDFRLMRGFEKERAGGQAGSLGPLAPTRVEESSGPAE
jgi:hypothetical protein